MPDVRPDKRSLGSGSRLRSFKDLGRYRVNDILLVSTLYDSFILSEDGQLSEVMLDEFLDLDLHHTPRLRRVSTGDHALRIARDEGRYNLIISSMHVADMSAKTLAEKVEAAGLQTPVISLAYDIRDLSDVDVSQVGSKVDRVFLWQGDVRILLAIVKYVEDRMNVARDTGEMGVQAIIVIEDNVRFYSSFLPVIYTELMRHSHSLLPDGMNRSHKLMRIQARPKILLCGTYEEAWRYFDVHQDDVLGVISDVSFPKDGQLFQRAGVEFAKRVRELQPDVPIMLQSGLHDLEIASEAASLGIPYVMKDSPTLLQELREFMNEGFGFGDFVFRTPDGAVVSVARDLRELESQLHVVPPESVAFHGERNHFSRWLKARTEFELAHFLRPRRVSDYETVEGLRETLIDALRSYRRQQHRGVVADFEAEMFEPESDFSRIGSGSLGGKGRGLAFVNFMLSDYDLEARFPEVQVSVPAAVVLATDIFDRTLEENHLRDFALESKDHQEVAKRFRKARFPHDVYQQLRDLLKRATYPLAIRSSSLLEDSQYQPFAGIYQTVMLSNDQKDLDVRVERLLAAIRTVYLSMFTGRTKSYLGASPYRLEEEKMAVIIQKVTGLPHENRFYPDISGVARSHNFYPVSPIKAKDGITAVALGLGATVVDGNVCFRFCPKYPQHVMQFSSVDDILRNSQRNFYGLELGSEGDALATDIDTEFKLTQFGLEVAEQDGSLQFLGSTYSPENNAIYDGVAREGVRLVSFAPVLKHEIFPLANILELMLEIGRRATGSPVEIEFAANVKRSESSKSEFTVLQLRPLALSRELVDMNIGSVETKDLICSSQVVLGHGKVDDIFDIVVVSRDTFDRASTGEIAAEVGRLNADLVQQGIPYVLIGIGRWGSHEPWLGIPVSWDQIAGAKVIVEAGFEDFKIRPSQGSHFFHNLTAFNVGYFTVNPESGEGIVDWSWLSAQPAVTELTYVRHLRLDRPITIKMNGKKSEGVILKP
mgnify:FL=1